MGEPGPFRDLDQSDLWAACQTLARLVRGEFPDLPLAEIAMVWDDDVTDYELAALRRVAARL